MNLDQPHQNGSIISKIIGPVDPQMSRQFDKGYQVYLSRETEDEGWNSFLARTPGGHHVQTSLWAKVKATLGWNAVRIVVKQGEWIIAGVQMSIRRIVPSVTVGIVSKGPVLSSEDPLLADFVFDLLLSVAKEHNVHCLIVQPPNNGEALTPLMQEKGFRPTTLEVAPTASIQIDLNRNLDAILAGMKKKTRRYIRHGLHSGVIGREGTEDDLGTYYQLLKATSQRTKWPIYSEKYFTEMFRVFGRRNQAKLFFAEYEGHAVSAQMLIAFGETVIAKNSGWSGQFKSLGANNVLEWSSIQWAKAQGYRCYDLEGVTQEIALSARAGSIHDDAKDSWCYYKLQYGGEVKLFPKAHIYIINPLANWVYTYFLSNLEKQPFARSILNSMRLR